MLQQAIKAATIKDILTGRDDGAPIHFFSPTAFIDRLNEFLRGFPGDVTFAVKANPTDEVLQTLCQNGINGFDVASPDEIEQIRRICPNAPMNYNNPVRSKSEIAAGIAGGVTSWSVDTVAEYQKLIQYGVAADAEIAVRIKLPVAGALYDFGAKFGANEETAIEILKMVDAHGHQNAMTFHVGTQCTDPNAYVAYIHACARIAEMAGVTLVRLNVGGGFPSGRDGQHRPLEPFFAAIRDAMSAFDERPVLLCEPGRGLVGDAFSYAVQVKSLRGNAVFLTDGIYGGLSEMVMFDAPACAVLGEDGLFKSGPRAPRRAFGPTCDSVDLLKSDLWLPDDVAEGDWIIFRSMGAYVTGVTTRFNGYGAFQTQVVRDIDAPYEAAGQV
ncbi:ornithine decarboxylase [Marivivens niveibacter]|uniref:ornithine decarboxylase n=1 Tax=Marivivens niveibacter TaxID=1930667 RepID=A0A251X1E7_9RHOB|nr:alanine racemase [Marivivens niveibacter]OUD10549.1 ornithine decarboxylase [Marivivens niveibacter]